MTPTTKLAHPFHCLLESGGERLTASFSNFVVAVLLLAALLVLALALAARTQTPRRSPIAVAL
jgi:hypothetical protein